MACPTRPCLLTWLALLLSASTILVLFVSAFNAGSSMRADDPANDILLASVDDSGVTQGLMWRDQLLPIQPALTLAGFPKAATAPVVPTVAFIITTPDQKGRNRLRHALAEISKTQLITDVRVVYGGPTNGSEFGCTENVVEPHAGCRFSLTVGHDQAWRAISDEGLAHGAWVFEDDVLFHDDFKELFPRYWGQVPPDFEVVYTGSYPIDMRHAYEAEVPWSSEDAVVYGQPAFGAHAYIVSATAAHRLDTMLRRVIWARGSVQDGPPQRTLDKPSQRQVQASSDLTLTAYDIIADEFLRKHGFKRARKAHTWVAFQAADDMPAVYQGIQFSSFVAWLDNKDCRCDDEPSEACKDYLPVIMVGLAFQHHHCTNMSRLQDWVRHYKKWHPEALVSPGQSARRKREDLELEDW